VKKWLVILVMGLILISSSGQAAEYVLRPGDALDISVLGYDELNVKPVGVGGIVVRPDGAISFPYVGEIQVAGLSAGEAAQVLAERLSVYYTHPIVTINLLKFSTTRVYVLGEVNKPGQYELDGNRNLMDAIGLAGGWTKDAAKTKVLLVHINQQGEPTKINLLALLQKGDISQNPTLKAGDIVYLSENGRINLTQDILPYVTSYYEDKYFLTNSK